MYPTTVFLVRKLCETTDAVTILAAVCGLTSSGRLNTQKRDTIMPNAFSTIMRAPLDSLQWKILC